MRSARDEDTVAQPSLLRALGSLVVILGMIALMALTVWAMVSG